MLSNSAGVGFLLVVWVAAASLVAQTPSPAAAMIDGEAISVAEVRQELGVALGERKITEAERPVLEAQTLGLLINRCLVLQYMERNHLGATPDDVQVAIDEFTKQLSAQNRTLDDHLRTLGFTPAELRRLFAWEIGWPRYLEKKLTPENLNKYFMSSRREFDGTKLVVRHILLKVANSASADEAQTAASTLKQLREQVLKGEITFAAAAEKHSQGATAAQGGLLGEIGRHAPMPATFNEAAFALKPGEISPPVATQFGVHLILCEREIPGTLTLENAEVQKAVRLELIRYLFQVMAERQRAGKKIEFTGAVPYLRPGTNELVLPTKSAAGPTAPPVEK
jgi:parvulin-like peptidyl-prolyl isomerase